MRPLSQVVSPETRCFIQIRSSDFCYEDLLPGQNTHTNTMKDSSTHCKTVAHLSCLCSIKVRVHNSAQVQTRRLNNEFEMRHHMYAHSLTHCKRRDEVRRYLGLKFRQLWSLLGKDVVPISFNIRKKMKHKTYSMWLHATQIHASFLALRYVISD